MATTYTARDITVLEGLEPVRKRPGMYIGGVDTRGLHHLVNEIVDNAIDEVINGYATRLDVTLFEGGREIEVTDNGRGIPVDIHPKYKKSALELILTTLHAGGKFDQGNYLHSGGLHGVGSSVVCALSSEMTVTVKRDGHTWQQTYAKGKATSKVAKISGSEKVRGSGTTVRFRPDVEIFGKLAFDAAEIRERLEAKTYLHRGLKVVFTDETQKPAVREELAHEGGLADWLTHVVAQRGKNADARGRVPPRAERRPPPRARARLDRGDGRARPLVRERHPDAVGRHARERAALRRDEGRPQLRRDARAPPKGVTRHGGGHPRRPRRLLSATSSSRSSRARRRTA
jgi:DNA gyrase/topoisomerase IV subunit B